MKFSDQELKTIFATCVRAIDWNESLIDAQRVEFTGTWPYEKIVPKELQKDVNKWRREIKQFNKIKDKIRQELTRKEK